MADIDAAELPACPECLKHDGGWSAWCDECHVLAREELRRLRKDLNDERVRNQHDRDLAEELRDSLLAEWKAKREYAARLAAVEDCIREYGAYGQVPEARIRAALTATL